MKIAFVSDLHANLQAWRAVLLDIKSMRLDAIICLGDAVGYGPNPADVVASLAANASHCLLGNHDAALCGKIPTSSFTDEAARVIEWTREHVGKSVCRYLSSLPLTLSAGDFRCAHGEFGRPSFYRYIHEVEDARDSWEAVPEQLLFVGHTHRPAVMVRRSDEKCRMLAAQDFALEPDFRYVVNVGSVGQPRDGDARAGYCIYDQEQKAVFWRRVPFDLDVYRDALRQAGISEAASPFLSADPLAAARQGGQDGFYPPTDPALAARNTVEVVAIDLLRKRMKAWRVLAMLLLAAAIGLGVCLAVFLSRHADHSLLVRGIVRTPLDAALAPRESNLLALDGTSTGPNEPLSGWSLALGDARRQNAFIERLASGESVLIMNSETPNAAMRLVSRDIMVEPGTKVAMQAMFLKAPETEGVFEVMLLGAADLPEDENITCAGYETLAIKSPNEPRQGGWLLCRQTLDLPARAQVVRMVIQGRFSGRVQVREIRFVRRK